MQLTLQLRTSKCRLSKSSTDVQTSQGTRTANRSEGGIQHILMRTKSTLHTDLINATSYNTSAMLESRTTLLRLMKQMRKNDFCLVSKRGCRVPVLMLEFLIGKQRSKIDLNAGPDQIVVTESQGRRGEIVSAECGFE